MSHRPIAVVKVEPNYKHIYEIKVAQIVSTKLYKITFIKYK